MVSRGSPKPSHQTPNVAERCSSINTVVPGYVPTLRVENQIPDTTRARDSTQNPARRDVLLALQHIKRFITVKQIPALVAFLCSGAAASITGTALTIENG
jgi:3-hydroxybutyrate dehydrogenase